MMTAEEVKKAGTIEIKYVPITEAIELIQRIRTKKDSLGMEMVDWIEWGDEVIGMVCDLFDIEKPEVEVREGKEKLRWYLKESVRLRKESEKLEEQSENYLDLVDHSFTEAQRDVIWENFGLPPSGVERLSKAVEEMGNDEEVKKDEQTKQVTTIIHISCDGEGKQRTVNANWWKGLSLDEIADTTARTVEGIVGRGELEEGTI